jgi:hypothetical protein
MWEDTWAIPLADAMRDSGGVLVEGARIPHDIAEAAFGELATANSPAPSNPHIPRHHEGASPCPSYEGL